MCGLAMIGFVTWSCFKKPLLRSTGLRTEFLIIGLRAIENGCRGTDYAAMPGRLKLDGEVRFLSLCYAKTSAPDNPLTERTLPSTAG